MKHIVLFGAGKSSTSLIEYLIGQLPLNEWQLTVLDADLDAAKNKTAGAPGTRAAALRVEDENARREWISSADIVISLLPPVLHIAVARDCITYRKNLLTASYVDAAMKELLPEIERNGLVFLCEMGLDPGIDHMSAMQIIHRLKGRGAAITSFRSHCGGLVAPESDDNPWRFKISWNPRNIVAAGKAGAVYLENGVEKSISYDGLFDSGRTVSVPGLGQLCWYPNRDSLSYIDAYRLPDIHTFIRTTLRYPEFCFGWRNIIELKLTDESAMYETDGMTLKNFFQQHLAAHGFSEWIESELTARFAQTKTLLEKLQELLNAEMKIDQDQIHQLREFMMVDEQGELMDISLEQIKSKAAATVAGQMHEANLSMKQLLFLGMDDDLTLINKGRCSAADILQFALEQKLALRESDHDMVVMLHELEYELDGIAQSVKSTLIVRGQDNVHTAMARTVGLPLGIAAKLVLQGKIASPGLHLPVLPEIYEPVMAELKEWGITFEEEET